MCVQLLGELYIYIYSKLRKVSSRLLHTRKARSFFISVSACNSGQQQQCGSLGLRQLALILGSIDMLGFENQKTIALGRFRINSKIVLTYTDKNILDKSY